MLIIWSYHCRFPCRLIPAIAYLLLSLSDDHIVRCSVFSNPEHWPFSWAYPVSEEWQTIANFIVNRPIFDSCVGTERRRGTSPRQWWWEQTMDLDAVRIPAAADIVVGADDDDSVGEK